MVIASYVTPSFHLQEQEKLKTYSDSAGPLPKFEGFPLPAHLANVVAPSTPQVASKIPQSTGAQSQEQNVITPEEKVRYANLFKSSGPQDGLLGGQLARLSVLIDY